MKLAEWRERLEKKRKQKDWFLAINPQSPIPPRKRQDFNGLDYYPPNPEYRLELTLHKCEAKTITLSTSEGEQQQYLRWGQFRFQLGGKQETLQVYKRNPEERWLFVPFKDTTNSKQTYGAGRYLDLQSDSHYLGEGRWILDFNEAYNPFCAYSKAYTCPLPPPENWLAIPIPAGEKKYVPETEK
ncbi:DUF1684 domain-containing protein [Candidatus Bathyarchaeota archaeon]|nr:DUF1684 domain-containing protein [Candidatus Bathyarchaeota archaeon]NIU81682.1 DUF1684 domain-containing protein [Candidatus Bathyarchaeota archaeon]NIV68328.1 DUF1684 domain-containing protein [Candidatus Bathyarchaeota archaeon]NIW34866.1 DUF1684 domain-containing protein [Candidatus Bathyarchaeota archaeon]